MRTAGLTHPKTKKLARQLGIKLPQTIGHLELLFDFVAKQTPRGDVGKWDNGVIADEALWEGDADDFVAALVESEWLDEDEEHRLVVHDWEDHMPSWVRAKLAKEKKKAAEESIDESIDPTTSLAKPSLAKRKTKYSYTPEFEEAWAAYPRRPDNNKATAFRAYSARLKNGADPAEILAGVKRYAAYCEAEGRTGTGFVKQAATFFGPDEHYKSDFTIEVKHGKDRPLSALERVQQRNREKYGHTQG